MTVAACRSHCDSGHCHGLRPSSAPASAPSITGPSSPPLHPPRRLRQAPLVDSSPTARRNPPFLLAPIRDKKTLLPGLIRLTRSAAADAASPDPYGDPAVPLPPEESRKSGSSRLRLAVVFGFWYFQNVVFDVYNKMVLNVVPYPWLLASFQLLVGSFWMASLWLSGAQPFPRPLGRPFFVSLQGPALFHTVGHISACVSFSKVAVSFTHVTKASEPVFSVVFSALLGARLYPLPVWLSVLPIVAGCSLAAVTEVSFDVQGPWCALISNVGFVLRNIHSKKSLQDFAHVDGLSLYGSISIVLLLYLFSLAIAVESAQWAEGFRRALATVPAPSTSYLWVM